MPKQKIALLLSYDGTDFCGWQIQRGQVDISIQGEIERALTKITGEAIDITGSGRTDSGVHATGQVAHFELETKIPPYKFRDALNSQLPRSIRIIKSRVVDDDFHARFGAKYREYGYYIYSGTQPPAHLSDFCHYEKRHFTLTELNDIASVIRGIHDFTTFTAAGDMNKSKVRHISCSSFHREGGALVYRIGGNAFLWRMVRSLAGTILMVAKQGGGAEEMKRRLDSCDRTQAGPTAPSRGLFLERVDYESKYSFF